MYENPWRDLLPSGEPVMLPAGGLFVLPIDRSKVEEFNERRGPSHAHYLHVDKILPEPFVGDRQAPIVLLSNNPGAGSLELTYNLHPRFVARMRDNYHHRPSDYPFGFLAPDYEGRGRVWWASKFKHLIKEFGEVVVAGNVLNVPYFPYPSQRFDHVRLCVRSQDYGFSLVRDAVERGAVVVLMRRRTRLAWFGAVPGLQEYRRLFEVAFPLNPVISPKNCRGYQEVVRAIREREEGR
jgi:hypothetical protein